MFVVLIRGVFAIESNLANQLLVWLAALCF